MGILLAVLPFLAGQSGPDPRAQPGNKFPLLAGGAKVEVVIPADYDRKRRYALLVWMGAAETSVLTAVTGGRRFVGVALPAGFEAKGGKIPWANFKPVLEAVQRSVPNIHPEMRIGTGEIADHLSPEFFNAFLLVAPPREPVVWGAVKGKPVLFVSREDDRALHDAARKAGADAEFLLIEGAGEPFPPKALDGMLDWMERKVLHRGIAEHAAAMERALGGKKWTEALAKARLILERPIDARPEYARARAAVKAINEAGDKALAPLLASPSAPALRKFAKEWEFCPCGERAAEAANELGEKELDAILASTEGPRAPKLKSFLKSWEGYPVYARALAPYDQEASGALEKITGGADKLQRYQKLKEFAAQWAPTNSSIQASLMREDIAAEALAEAKAVADKPARRSKLEAFLKAFGDSTSAEEARRLLKE